MCDVSVFVTRVKTYSCTPSSTIAQIFSGGGLFIFSMAFPSADIKSGGVSQLDCYASAFSSPLLFHCDLAFCTRSTVSGSQQISCQTIVCTYTDAADTQLRQVVSGLAGVSTVILETDGRARFFQETVPVTVEMDCTASGCKFPGEGAERQSDTAVIVAVVVAVVLAAIVAALVLWCWYRGRLLMKAYLAHGSDRVPYDLSWHNLSCTILVSVSGKYKKRQLELLQPCTGVARSGTMTAIIGESGAGKTTLLDMLARRKTLGKLTGEVRVNGAVPGNSWRRISGYVLQNDLFLETMTTREHLEFVSNLKLPLTMTKQERADRVDAMLDRLGLSHVQDSVIGGVKRKGLSGGERKRLSIATQMLPGELPFLIFLFSILFFYRVSRSLYFDC